MKLFPSISKRVTGGEGDGPGMDELFSWAGGDELSFVPHIFFTGYPLHVYLKKNIIYDEINIRVYLYFFFILLKILLTLK